MLATYLIGNGFDLAANLDTGAKNVIHVYRELVDEEYSKDKEEAAINALHLSLHQDFELWSDFEMALATSLARACTKFSNPAAIYTQAFEHFVHFFHDRIATIETSIASFQPTVKQLKQFRNGVNDFMKDGLRPKQATILQAFLRKHERENWSIRFITFNYTTLLDTLVDSAASNPQISSRKLINNVQYSRSLTSPLHIHGNITDGHGIILGPDNAQQIIVPALSQDEVVREMTVKPLQNDAREDLSQETALDYISQSSIICIFGMSLGKSDETWWKALAKWLNDQSAERLLIMHTRAPNEDILPYAHAARTRNVKDLFLDRAGIKGKDERSTLQPRILISENSQIFNLGIDFAS